MTIQRFEIVCKDYVLEEYVMDDDYMHYMGLIKEVTKLLVNFDETEKQLSYKIIGSAGNGEFHTPVFDDESLMEVFNANGDSGDLIRFEIIIKSVRSPKKRSRVVIEEISENEHADGSSSMTNLMVSKQVSLEGEASNIGDVIENKKQSNTAQEEQEMDKEIGSVDDAWVDLNPLCNEINDDEFAELVQEILGDASMLGGGSKVGVEDEVHVSAGGEENDMGYNSEMENPENHRPRRPSDDEKTDSEFEDEEEVNDREEFGGGRVEDVQLDQIFKDSEDFREAIRDYAIHKGFEFRTLKSAKYRVTLQCKDKECKWRIHASKTKCGSQFQVSF